MHDNKGNCVTVLLAVHIVVMPLTTKYSAYLCIDIWKCETTEYHPETTTNLAKGTYDYIISLSSILVITV